MPRRFVLSCTLVLIACAADADDRDTTVDALAGAWCEMQARCGPETCATFIVDRDACELQAATQFSPGPVAADTFDLAFSQACLDDVLAALDELACDEAERPWAWAERVCSVWHGTGEVGDECRPFEFP